MVIYDQNASGYASSVAEIIPSLLRDVRRSLHCASECDTACQSCLLHYDTRFRVDELDRYAALRFLTEDWLDKLALPEELQLFGTGVSQAEYRPLHESVTQDLAVPDALELRIYLSEEIAKWDIASSPLRRWVQVWSASGSTVKLVLPANALSAWTPSDRFMLGVLSNMVGVTLWSGESLHLKFGGALAVEVVHKDGVVCWASRDAGLSMPDIGWGTSNDLLVRSTRLPSGGILREALELEVQAPLESASGLHKLEILNQLDGASTKFGKDFLRLLEDQVGSELVAEDDAIVAVQYQDRYLNAPMPCALMLEFFNSLKSRYADEWEVDRIVINLAPIPEPKLSRRPTKFYDNWGTDADRKAALLEAFDYCGMELDLQQAHKRDSIHARVMEISLRSGRCWRVWLDQGFSYWKHASQASFRSMGGAELFPFHSDAKKQGQCLAEASMVVEGQGFPTFVFVEKG